MEAVNEFILELQGAAPRSKPADTSGITVSFSNVVLP
jgi:hypothetical protein